MHTDSTTIGGKTYVGSYYKKRKDQRNFYTWTVIFK